MTAAAHMPNSCWGTYGKIAVVETDGVHTPKQIHPRHRAVIRIVGCWDRLNIGKTDQCAFRRKLAEAKATAEKLNASVCCRCGKEIPASEASFVFRPGTVTCWACGNNPANPITTDYKGN